MPIQRLTAVNYKAFPILGTSVPHEGTFSPGINLLVGPNSSGKTTIINALRLAFGRDAATSQGHTTRSMTRQGCGDRREDFHDPTRRLMLTVDFEWPADELSGNAQIQCDGPTHNLVRHVNGKSIDRMKDLPPQVGWLRDHVFSSGWPRIISRLESRAFEAPDGDPAKSAESNELAYAKAWPSLSKNAKLFFGFDPGPAPARATEEIGRLFASRTASGDGTFGLALQDGNGHPLHESSDGLAHLLYLMMEIEKHRWSTTFLLEEPDVYLHPGLQRQFMRYIAHLATRAPWHQFFITTHSPYMLDFAAELQGPVTPSIYRVSIEEGDLQLKRAEPTSGWDVLRALGHSPADLLHPNGIIWVEGPSDVIYIRTWLELFAPKDEQIRWGLDAEILWYGGALLARATTEDRRFWSAVDDEDVAKLVSLTTANRNAVVIMDRDDFPEDGSTRRKQRIIDSLTQEYQLAWVTDGATNSIEDYVAPTLRAELLIPTERAPTKTAKIDAADAYRRRVMDLELANVVDGSTDILVRMAAIYDLIKKWRNCPVR